ncbi:MAG: hypothetical protein LUD51_00095 [Clostridia bacterium]|nr:hypothetical protein [Clostridia bacterium]
MHSDDEDYDDDSYLEDADSEDEDWDDDDSTGVDDLIDQLTESQLRDLLKELALNDSKIANLITVRFSKDSDMDDLADFFDELENIEVRYSSFTHGISYSYVSDLSHFMDKYVGKMIEDGKFKAANELVIAVYDKIGQLGSEDPDGELYDVMQDCMKYWRDIEQKCSEMPCKAEILDRLNDAVNDGHEYDEYYRDIEKLMNEGFQERECLMRKMERVDEQISHWEKDQKSDQSIIDLSLGSNVAKKLELMYRIGYPQDETDAEAKKYWWSPYVRIWAADNLDQRGKTDEAVRVLKESRNQDKEDGIFVSREVVRLISMYEKLGRKKDCKNELLFYIFACDHGPHFNDTKYSYDLREYIRKLKALCNPEEWSGYRERILEGNLVNKFVFLDEEGLYDRLLSELLKEPPYQMDQYEKKLKPLYPEEVKKYYADYLMRRAPQTTKRSEYAALMPYLKKLVNYPGGMELAMDIASQWKDRFAGRRAFLDELHKAGF